MSIFLGNLPLKAVVKEKYVEQIQLFFDNNGYKYTAKCDDIEKEKGNYHIYDMPRVIHICGRDKVEEFIDFLRKEDLSQKAFIERIAVAAV